MNAERLQLETFRAFVVAALPLARIVKVSEGWPCMRGRLGSLTWRGREHGDGSAWIYVETARRHVARLLAIAGLERWQMGDTEATLRLPADDVTGLRAVAAVLHLRRRAPARVMPVGRPFLARGHAVQSDFPGPEHRSSQDSDWELRGDLPAGSGLTFPAVR
jgi:hypothetical protein